MNDVESIITKKEKALRKKFNAGDTIFYLNHMTITKSTIEIKIIRETIGTYKQELETLEGKRFNYYDKTIFHTEEELRSYIEVTYFN